MSTETIARRYSTALADVVFQTGQSDAIKTELAMCAQLFGGNAELQNVFSNPTVAHSSKEKLLESLIAKANPTKTTANFLRVLLQNSRITDLGEINERFAAVLDERGGLISAEITSARELPEAERADFEKNLERLTGKKVNVNYAVNKEIIGGVVTRIGSTVYDGSVKMKLENLKEQLISG